METVKRRDAEREKERWEQIKRNENLSLCSDSNGERIT